MERFVSPQPLSLDASRFAGFHKPSLVRESVPIPERIDFYVDSERLGGFVLDGYDVQKIFATWGLHCDFIVHLLPE